MSEVKLIKFKLNKEPLFAKKLDINETLFQVRNKLENKLSEKSIFTFVDGTIIEKEDEQYFTLQDIIEKVNNFYELHILEEEEEVNEDESFSVTEKPTSVSNQKSTDASKKNEIQNKEEDNNENSEAGLPSWLIDDSKDNIEYNKKNNIQKFKKDVNNFFQNQQKKKSNKDNKNKKKETPQNENNYNYNGAPPHANSSYKIIQEYPKNKTKFTKQQLSKF